MKNNGLNNISKKSSPLGKLSDKTEQQSAFNNDAAKRRNGFPKENRQFSTLGKPNKNRQPDYLTQTFNEQTNNPQLIIPGVNDPNVVLQNETWYLMQESGVVYNGDTGTLTPGSDIIVCENGDLLLWTR